MNRQPHFRQEVLNVVLAQLLQDRGVISAPEEITSVGPKKQRRMPDVIVTFRGLRTAIEGEIDRGKIAETKALASAKRRVEENIAHVGIAVVYPSILSETPFQKLKTSLSSAQLRIAVHSESGSTDFVSGDVDYLERTLRNTFDQLVKEDVVTKAVAMLDSSIERFANVMVGNKGDLGRVAEALGISELPTSRIVPKEGKS